MVAPKRRAERASGADVARCCREPCEAVVASASRRVAARRRPRQRAPAVALAPDPAQGRPPPHCTARFTYGGRHPGDRNLFRTLRLCRKGRRLRPALDFRNGAAVRGMGCRLAGFRLASPFACRRIRHHARQCARAGGRVDLIARLLASTRLASGCAGAPYHLLA